MFVQWKIKCVLFFVFIVGVAVVVVFVGSCITATHATFIFVIYLLPSSLTIYPGLLFSCLCKREQKIAILIGIVKNVRSHSTAPIATTHPHLAMTS